MDIFGLHLSLVSIICCGLLLISFFLLLLYYSFIFLRPGLYKDAKRKGPEKRKHEAVSIVVYSKNQAYLLKEKLFILLEQEYPDYEVIIVNHASQDETNYLLKVFSETYKNLKIVDLPSDINTFQSKKYPLSIGIKCSKNDIILLTDAESIPNTYQWISRMEEMFTEGIHIVLGYAKRESSNLLRDHFILYEEAMHASNLYGFALLKQPYTGMGSNLAYRRSFFFDKGGFIQHYDVQKGDDVLFVNQNSTPSNTAFCFHPESFVTTKAYYCIQEWLKERKKEMKLFFYLKRKDQFIQSIYPLSGLFYRLSFLYLLLTGFPYEILIGVLAIKVFWQIFCFHSFTKRFELKNKALLAPLFESFFLIYSGIQMLPLFIKRVFKWR